MVTLLIYINRNNVLLLLISVIWICPTTIVSFLWFFEDYQDIIKLYYDRHTSLRTAAVLSLLVILVVCSCINALAEQKYLSKS
jgi:capsular polysaccharide biosynthesis protein